MEEVASNHLSRIADSLILRSDSDISKSIRAYENDGLTHKKAIKRTIADCFYEDVAAGLVGGASGIVMGAGYDAVSGVSRRNDTQYSIPEKSNSLNGDIQSIDAVNDLSSEACGKRFAENVDKVFSGEINNRTDIEIGDTPQILQEKGKANALKIKINQNTMFKIAYPQGYIGAKDTGHNLGIPALKQLPKQLSDPLAILKSNTEKNSIVILTEWNDTRGKPVIIPLHLDSKGNLRTEGEFTAENKVASMYGKNNITSMLTDENGESNVMYTKNNKGIKQTLSDRLQLPVDKSEDSLIKNSINQKGWDVKDFYIPNNEKNTQNPEAKISENDINTKNIRTAKSVERVFNTRVVMENEIKTSGSGG